MIVFFIFSISNILNLSIYLFTWLPVTVVYTKTIIRKNHELYEYFSDISSKSNNLYNATLFRMRQVLTAVNKDQNQLTSNEREVLDEISNALPKMRKRCGTEEIRKSFVMPTKEKSFLSYY